MSPSILLLCFLAETSWAFVPDDPDFRGIPEDAGSMLLNVKEIVGRLLEIPFGTKLTFTLKYVLDSRSKIRFTVDMSGFLPASVEANFVLNKLNQQLEIGEISICSRGFRGFSQPEDPNAVVRRFLEHVKQVFVSRSPVLVGNLLDEAEVVKQIISFLSSGALIEFPLIESKWINQEQIEYTAEVNVSMIDRFEAIFVYHPQRNVLISGRGYGCPSK
ncbi:unnamed protein product [Caenorhabditis nigoni]